MQLCNKIYRYAHRHAHNDNLYKVHISRDESKYASKCKNVDTTLIKNLRAISRNKGVKARAHRTAAMEPRAY